MKHFRIILSITIAAFSFSAANAKAILIPDMATKDTMVYQCPMKCEGEKTYAKAGKCPKCGMKLKPMPKPVAAVKYQCPMKCEGEKTYDKAGKCPKCGMNLKALPKPVASVSYQCPMKCEGDKTYDKAGKCPVCNMTLTKVEAKKTATDQGHNHN